MTKTIPETIPANEIAKLNPIPPGNYVICFFCGVDFDDTPTPSHAPDCLWVRCGGQP